MKPKTKNLSISAEACELIDSMACGRNNSNFVQTLEPPTGRVAPKVYAEAKKALITLGGVWKSPRFVFKDKTLTVEALRGIIKTGQVFNSRQSFQFFETPKNLAWRIGLLASKLLENVRSPRILEPSAGNGALINALIQVGVTAHCIQAVEVNPDCYDTLRAKYPLMSVKHTDFGQYLPDRNLPLYDAVLMNPPFDRNIWQEHVLHAIKFVNNFGFIIAVVPRTATLDFLPIEVRHVAKLIPVKADFDHTPTKVSILTIGVPAKTAHKAFLPILDITVDDTKEPLQSPDYYLKLIRKDMAEVLRNLDEMEAILKD